MLHRHQATPCPVSTTSVFLKRPTFQPCEATADIQHVTRKAPTRRRKSIRPQTRSKCLVARSFKAISNGAANVEHLSEHGYPIIQMRFHNFTGSGVTCPSERHHNDSFTFPDQDKATNHQDDEYIRKKPRRRTIWVPSNDTTILTIHPGVQSDAKIVNDSFLGVTNHPNARDRRQKKPLAVIPKRAPLQPMMKSLQGNEDPQGSSISMSLLHIKAKVESQETFWE